MIQIVKPKNSYEFDVDFPTGETFKGLVSLTVPDQSLTVREILVRFANHQPVDGDRSYYYDGYDSFDDADPTASPDFDLADATHLAQQVVQEADRRKAKAKAISEEAQRRVADEQKAAAEAAAKSADSSAETTE